MMEFFNKPLLCVSLFFSRRYAVYRGFCLCCFVVLSTPACFDTYDPDEEAILSPPTESVLDASNTALSNQSESSPFDNEPLALIDPEAIEPPKGEGEEAIDTEIDSEIVSAPDTPPADNTDFVFELESTTKVDFSRPIQLEDHVVLVEGNQLWTRLGILIVITEATELQFPNDPASDSDVTDQLLGQVGASVQAQGWFDGQQMVWTQIVLGNTEPSYCRLQAIVSNIDADQNTFELLQTTVNTQSTIENHFLDGIGEPVFRIGRGVFFDVLARIQSPEGFLVQAISDQKGDGCVEGYLTAEEVAFEAICTSTQNDCR